MERTWTWEEINETCMTRGFGVRQILDVCSGVRRAHGHAATAQNVRYTWEQINRALMESGHSAPRIARFLSALNKRLG